MAQMSLFVFTMTVTTPLAAASSLIFGSTIMDSPACVATMLLGVPCVKPHSSVRCSDVHGNVKYLHSHGALLYSMRLVP